MYIKNNCNEYLFLFNKYILFLFTYKKIKNDIRTHHKFLYHFLFQSLIISLIFIISVQCWLLYIFIIQEVKSCRRRFYQINIKKEKGYNQGPNRPHQYDTRYSVPYLVTVTIFYFFIYYFYS